MRVHTAQGLDVVEKTLEEARRLALTALVQFQDREHCAPERVREAAGHLKGKARYWEIINEPNFSMTPEAYAELLARVVPLLKEIDPECRIAGPAVCGLNLDWHEKLFRAGGGKYLDIISIHDYEGNESIDPGHWRWKIGQLRESMVRHGLGGRPIWQTERAIGGVRADNFLGGVQAVRIGLQRDILDTLDITNEHNLHYYLNQAGYGSVPTYIWSSSGPHPAALTLRTRDAMIRGRRFAGVLDFGPSGDKLFLGLRFDGEDGSTIALRQYGASADPEVTLAISRGETLDVVDSFGNRRTLPLRDGKVTLSAPLLPIYLRLAKGLDVTAPRIDYGRNLAPDASFTYSGKTESDMAILSNGIFEVTHAGSPWGPYWAGDLSQAPQHLDIAFSRPRAVNRIHIFSMRADNPHCALIDFDVQARADGRWATVAEVRMPLPPSDLVRTADSRANTWYMDQNIGIAEFPPLSTDRLRIIALRSTLGFHPDATAVQATGWQAGGPNLHLREIEIYGPPPAIEIDARFAEATKDRAFDREPVRVTVFNRTNEPCDLAARILTPEGWRCEPAEVPLRVGAADHSVASVHAIAPAEIPTGRIAFEAGLDDRAGKPIDSRRFFLDVLPPVALTPEMPSAIDPARQPVTVTIRNLTARPLGGRIRVTLTGKGTIGPIEAPFDPIAPDGRATVDVPVPGLNLTEAAWQVTFEAIADRLVTRAVQTFAEIRLWQVVGPFPNAGGSGFDAVYEPEKAVDVTKPVTLPGGATVAWRPAANQPTGFVDLLRLFQPNTGVCAYAALYVKSPTARRALLSAGSDDGIKAWVNRAAVLSRNVTRGAAPRQDEVPVDLRAGWNEVLLKITQGEGGWGFYLDLLTLDGEPMPDLVYCPVPGP